jgi:Icc-related predicted phosphoesterase
MTFGVLADVHGNFEAMHAAMARHPDVPYWLCVGDLASRAGGYPEPRAPLYWIKGNNENFDAIEQFVNGTLRIPNLHYIPNGTAVRIDDLSVAGLGGTYAPTFYDVPAARLPSGAPAKRRNGVEVARNDRRRHFVREEVDACKRLRHVDVLLTHEAARPLLVEAEGAPPGSRRMFVGKRAINEVLAALSPRLHLCGHHHRFAAITAEGVPSICVDRVSRSYLLVDRATFAWQKIDQAA